MTEQKYSPPRPRRSAGRITIQDVANVAGVSIGTVSRVLNNRTWVSEDTREKVMLAVRKTGFTANASARSLVNQRTQSVALVLGAAPTTLFEDPNYAIILQEASRALADADYSLSLLTAPDAHERERVARYLRSGHVDGVLFVSPAESGSDPLLDFLESGALPTIVCGNPFAESRRIPLVQADDAPGSEALGEHFRRMQYQRTAAIVAHFDTLGPRTRVDGFQRGLGRALVGVEPTSGYTRQAGYDAMRTILASPWAPDSVFATSDALARGAIEAAQDAGLLVPSDMAVAGFDDSSIAVRSTPSLTTVRQPVVDVARTMVREVLAGIEGQEVVGHSLPTSLIIRESA
ncbi:LacI family DNA-binding transcriptional regulator [Microbacterium sp. 22215]|uniref:LacI family DNA-binding transcriptional regulator n=1 Tax=Microbacterium sp. 22215 TaxID=3453893 RepID=UPI003F87FF30